MVAVGFGVFSASLIEANHSVPYTFGALLGEPVHRDLRASSARVSERRADQRRREALVGCRLRDRHRSRRSSTRCSRRTETCKPHACPDNLLLGLTRSCGERRPDGLVDRSWPCSLRRGVVAAGRPVAPCDAGIAAHPAPVYLAGGLSFLLLLRRLHRDASVRPGPAHVVSVALIVTFTAVPFLFLAGLLGTTIARGAGIGSDLQRRFRSARRPGEVQEGLRLSAARRDGRGRVLVRGGRPLRRHRRQPLRAAGGHAPAGRHAARLRRRAGRGDRPRRRAAARSRSCSRRSRARRASPSSETSCWSRCGPARERYRALLQAHAGPHVPHLARAGAISPTARRASATSSSRRSSALTLWDRLPQELAERVLEAGRAALEHGRGSA